MSNGKAIIDKSGLEKKISDAEKLIPDTSGLVKKREYNAKITKIEGKAPSITGSATNSALDAAENRISNIINLVKKTVYNTNISEIEKKVADDNHDKYITTLESNKVTAEIFDLKLKQANLVTKTDIDTEVRSLNKTINSNKVKHLLVENELKKLQTFDASYFIGKSGFEEDGAKII